ncbi:MAG TPA: hypothetical protein VJU61_09575 [Polyangiaceae bacterium]|nr:hypothetical protein [Polyangiaceae bacterium]
MGRFPRCCLAATGAWLAISGCGSEAPDPETGYGALDGIEARELPYEPCAADQRVGEFTIALAERYTSVDGQVYDGVVPKDVPTLLAEEGGCRLLSSPAPQCNPACLPSSEVCGTDNACLPRPVARDLGTVTVRGLLVPVQMQANGVTKGYSNPATPRLPHPGFAPGADLRIFSSGGDYAPIQLRGWGVSLLQGVNNPVAVRAGEPVLVTWQAPEAAGPARVHLNLNINHHGSNSEWIECDAADEGSAMIPAGLVDALLARGQSGFPTLTATRRTASSVLIEPGCVELLVSSEITSDVSLDDFTSCSDASDCAPGQSCRPSELYCE